MDLREIEWGNCGLHSTSSEHGSVVGSREYGSEPLSSIKGGEFLDWLSDC
jgi:hypothetical protein